MRSYRLLFGLVLASLCSACGGAPTSDGPVLDLAAAGGLSTLQQNVLEGGPNPADISVVLTNSGTCALTFSQQHHTADGASWLTVTPGGGTIAAGGGTSPLAIHFDVVSTALQPRTYTGTIRVDAACTLSGQPALGSPRNISVNLTVRRNDAVLSPSADAVTQDVVALANVWDPAAGADAGSARAGHSAVWTGRQMIVWGGNSGAITLANGSAYTPATNSWTGVSPAAPARANHTAVWTGTRMIVWGGTAAASFLNSGDSYDPQADAWSALPTAGAPSARAEHTAVWTGARMIIWGGGGGENTGARYDPATNSWAATSTSGAPQARMGHAAVWTGTRMIVWGGSTAAAIGNETSTGGRYDPLTDSWSSTRTGGAPSPRRAPLAVWTGAQMIVWGGEDPAGNTLNSGGRYDPATNTWTTMSQAGAPAGRTRATAIWTGARMVVWGGSNTVASGGEINTGGIYDPQTDTWSATNIVDIDLPSVRVFHTSVWTGESMIVWGGRNAVVSLANGAIFR